MKELLANHYRASAQRSLTSLRAPRGTARRDQRTAFTLIEILLVLAILVVIAGAVAMNVIGVADRANQDFAKTQIKTLKDSVKQYRVMVGSYPSSLDALYTQPTDLPDPTKWTQLLDEPVPMDPWGRPYEYKIDGSKFEIRSAGPDGQSNTEDDIVG